MQPILECKALTKRFGTTAALDAVDMTVQRGRIVGLLGPNGSGKTTLLKLASGLLAPDAGAVLIDGLAPCPATKRLISYLPDRMYFEEWMRVSDLVAFFRDFYDNFDTSRAADMLKRLGIDQHERIKNLSKGTKEKVQLILVMSRNVPLYLLDEPIGGVDPAARDYILHTILSNYSENATVLISTHLISDVETVLDDVIFLSAGHVVLTSSVDAIREKEGKSVDTLFREVFRC